MHKSHERIASFSGCKLSSAYNAWPPQFMSAWRKRLHSKPTDASCNAGKPDTFVDREIHNAGSSPAALNLLIYGD
jgi:hypothetical protein